MVIFFAAVGVLELLLRICDFGLGGLPHFHLIAVVSDVFVLCA